MSFGKINNAWTATNDPSLPSEESKTTHPLGTLQTKDGSQRKIVVEEPHGRNKAFSLSPEEYFIPANLTEYQSTDPNGNVINPRRFFDENILSETARGLPTRNEDSVSSKSLFDKKTSTLEEPLLSEKEKEDTTYFDQYVNNPTVVERSTHFPYGPPKLPDKK